NEYVKNREYLGTIAVEPSRATIVGRSLLEGRTVHVPDAQADPDYKVYGVAVLGCLVPDFDGASSSHDSKEALWDKFYTAAPQRRRQSVEQYKIVKRA